MKNKNILIISLIMSSIILIIFGAYIVAKYTSIISGEINATTGSWNFKVNNSSSQIETIDLADTIINNVDGDITEGKIAPGTKGAINLVLDASEVDVPMGYKIQIYNFINKPTNLEFYLDSNCTTPIELEDGRINIQGYIPLEQTELIRTIYWKWPYKIGYTEQEIEQNDTIDSQDSGKEVACTINITGEQILKLVNQVEIGDYVNYDASSGIAVTYTTDESLTGSSEISTFSSSDEMEWRVLSRNTQTGEVTLVSADPTAELLFLNGTLGYINGETVLNEIGALYGHGKGAIGGRSITLEDIEQYSSYDKTTWVETKSFTEGIFIGEDGTLVTASNDNPIIVTGTGYIYEAQGYFENTIVYNMLFKKSNDVTENDISYWLNTKVRFITSNTPYYVRYGMHCIVSDSMFWGPFYQSSGNSWPVDLFLNVRPVVSLQPNIYTTGQDSNGVWQLVTE